jgi:hypothetical protein
VRTAIERLAALIRRSFSRHSYGQEKFAIERALAHCVIAVVGEKDRIVGADGRAVRPFENAITQERKNWARSKTMTVFAASEAIDLIAHRPPPRQRERPNRRVVCPNFDHFATIVTVSQYRPQEPPSVDQVSSLVFRVPG